MGWRDVMCTPEGWVPVDPLNYGKAPEWMQADVERNWRKAMNKTETIPIVHGGNTQVGGLGERVKEALSLTGKSVDEFAKGCSVPAHVVKLVINSGYQPSPADTQSISHYASRLKGGAMAAKSMKEGGNPGAAIRKQMGVETRKRQYKYRDRLRRYLDEHGMTQAQLSRESGCHPSIISGFLRGVSVLPEPFFEAIVAMLNNLPQEDSGPAYQAAVQKHSDRAVEQQVIAPSKHFSADADDLPKYAVQLEDRLHNLTVMYRKLSDSHAKAVARLQDLDVRMEAMVAASAPKWSVWARLANWARRL